MEDEFISGINIKKEDAEMFSMKDLGGNAEKKEYVIPKLNKKLSGD